MTSMTHMTFMSPMTRLSLLSLLTIFLLSSCASNEIGDSKDVNPESVFFDYKVFGDGDTGYVTVKLQYRFGGPNGTTLVLADPSKVELDGVPIAADSSKWNGAYYEVTKRADEFIGNHSIVFTGTNNKQYREDFKFLPVSLRNQIPDTVTRVFKDGDKTITLGDVVLEFEGLDFQDYVRVILTDTAFRSEGVNRLDTVLRGQIVITQRDLKSLVNGPIHLEIYREVERPLKNSTREGGRISFSYGLKRDFYLR